MQSNRKELFETGKSVDAAIDSACEKLGCSREDCEWEIIDLPKRGFLGLKNIPAKVRVSIEIPEEKPVKAAKPQFEARKPDIRPQPQKPKPQFAEKPRQPAKPQQSENPQRVGEPQKAVERERQENSVQPRVSKKREAPKLINPDEIKEKELLARDYLAEMLEAAGLKADFAISREHGGSYINITGDGLGMIIGRRGETLDAIQYLAGLVANRGEGDYLRLTVDCGDYRLKRKNTLEALAKKLASQVLSTNISKTLEPMNPFERRIIHATVSEIEGVSSSSVGEEPNRRVIITSPNAKPAPRERYRGRDDSRGNFGRSKGPRHDFTSRDEAGENNRERRDRDSRDRDNRRGTGRPPRQAQTVPQGPPKQTPESEVISGVSLGKIEL